MRYCGIDESIPIHFGLSHLMQKSLFGSRQNAAKKTHIKIEIRKIFYKKYRFTIKLLIIKRFFLFNTFVYFLSALNVTVPFIKQQKRSRPKSAPRDVY